MITNLQKVFQLRVKISQIPKVDSQHVLLFSIIMQQPFSVLVNMTFMVCANKLDKPFLGLRWQ